MLENLLEFDFDPQEVEGKFRLCSLVAQLTLLEKVKKAKQYNEEAKKICAKITYGQEIQD